MPFTLRHSWQYQVASFEVASFIIGHYMSLAKRRWLPGSSVLGNDITAMEEDDSPISQIAFHTQVAPVAWRAPLREVTNTNGQGAKDERRAGGGFDEPAASRKA